MLDVDWGKKEGIKNWRASLKLKGHTLLTAQNRGTNLFFSQGGLERNRSVVMEERRGQGGTPGTVSSRPKRGEKRIPGGVTEQTCSESFAQRVRVPKRAVGESWEKRGKKKEGNRGKHGLRRIPGEGRVAFEKTEIENRCAFGRSKEMAWAKEGGTRELKKAARDFAKRVFGVS